MLNYLWVSLGGALGTAARFWISGLAAERFGLTFPFGTIIVNITGSLLIGFLAGLSLPEGRWLFSPTSREFLMVGFCGGYTTFSSFSLQTLILAQEGEWLRAGANTIGSLVFCLLAVWFGYFLAVTINKP